MQIYPLAILGLGAGEILLILFFLILIFGASRLPKIGQSMGKGMRQFRKGLKGEGEEEKEEEKDDKQAENKGDKENN